MSQDQAMKALVVLAAMQYQTLTEIKSILISQGGSLTPTDLGKTLNYGVVQSKMVLETLERIR